MYEKISQNNSIPFVEIEVVQDGENGCNIFTSFPMYKEQNKWLSIPTFEAYTKVFHDLDPFIPTIVFEGKVFNEKALYNKEDQLA